MHTANGLKWVVIAFILYLLALAVQIVSGLVALSLLSGALTNPGTFVPVLLAGIVSGILLLITIIFSLVGFHSLHKGRNEYGPGHARDVRRAFYLLIAAIILAVIGGVVQFVVALAGFQFDFITGTVQFNPDAIYLSTVLGIAFGIVVAALVAALLVLSVRNLARPDHHRWLYVAAALGTATPGISGAITLIQLPRILQRISDPFGGISLDATAGLPGIVSGSLGIVTFLVLLIVYRAAKARVDTGELKSIAPPVQPTAWFPGPVAPPWMPPPQAPPAPPPQQPPPPP